MVLIFSNSHYQGINAGSFSIYSPITQTMCKEALWWKSNLDSLFDFYFCLPNPWTYTTDQAHFAM